MSLKSEKTKEISLEIYHDLDDIKSLQKISKEEALELTENIQKMLSGLTVSDTITILKNTTLRTCYIIVDDQLTDMENTQRNKFEEDYK